MLGFLLALPAPRGHELPDGDPVFEGCIVHGALSLDQLVLGSQPPPHKQLLQQRHRGLGGIGPTTSTLLGVIIIVRIHCIFHSCCHFFRCDPIRNVRERQRGINCISICRIYRKDIIKK